MVFEGLDHYPMETTPQIYLFLTKALSVSVCATSILVVQCSWGIERMCIAAPTDTLKRQKRET